MRYILATAALLLSMSTFAGSRNGYRLVFIDASEKKDPQITELLIQYFNTQLPPNTYRCENTNRFIDFDLVYIHRRPRQITEKLARDGIASNEKALENLRRALRSFRDSEINQGFDGLIVFRNNGKLFELTTIGATAHGYKKAAQLSGKTSIDFADLKTLFCGSLAELDYAYPGQ